MKRGKNEIDIYGVQGYADGNLGGEWCSGDHIHAEFYITSNESIQYFVFVGEQDIASSRDPGTIIEPNKGGFNDGGAGETDIYWSDTER